MWVLLLCVGVVVMCGWCCYVWVLLLCVGVVMCGCCCYVWELCVGVVVICGCCIVMYTGKGGCCGQAIVDIVCRFVYLFV